MIGLYISVHNPGTTGRLVHTFSLLHMGDPNNFISNTIFDPNNARMIGPWNVRRWAFLFLFIGFAIKLPMVPLHMVARCARRSAYTHLRYTGGPAAQNRRLRSCAYSLPGVSRGGPALQQLRGDYGRGVHAYGALNAMASKDLKRLIAYSSVSHMGFVAAGACFSTHGCLPGCRVPDVQPRHNIGHVVRCCRRIVRPHARPHHSKLLRLVRPHACLYRYGCWWLSSHPLGLPGLRPFIAEIMVFLGAFKAPECQRTFYMKALL